MGGRGSPSSRGPEISENPRPGVWIASELQKLYLPAVAPPGLLQGPAGRKQEHRSQGAESTVIGKHHGSSCLLLWITTSELSGLKNHLRVLTGAGK